MIDRKNPLSLEVLGELPMVPLNKQIEDLVHRVKIVDRERSDWLKRQLYLIKARFGVRRPRSVPWKGASNVTIPLIDGSIRKWKPGMAALVLDADPIASFVAMDDPDFESARVVEPFWTWYFVHKMGAVRPVMTLLDLIAQRGFAFSLESWHYETKKRIRIAHTKALFPEGLDQFLSQSGIERGPDAPANPIDLIMERLEQEYALSRRLPEEAAMLQRAAEGILAGAEYVKLIYKEIAEDRCNWDALDPIFCVWPHDEDPEDASFFTIMHEMDRDTLVQLAESGVLNQDEVADLVKEPFTNQANFGSGQTGDEGSSSAMRQTIQRVLDQKAGLQDRTTADSRELTPIWQIYCRLQLEPGQPRERCVMWYAPLFKKVLHLTHYPLPLNKWPITAYSFSRDAGRLIDQRGMAEMLLPFQRLVSAFHNARIDASQIVLAPVMKMKVGSADKDPGSIDWRPGGIIPVRKLEDLEPVVHDLRILGELLQEEQVGQRLAENYIGTFDATLTNLRDRQERRTASEVNAIQNLTASIFDLDAKLFQQQFSRSLNKLWQLYDEFGPVEEFFRVMGENKPRTARKADLAKKFDIVASGTPANTNKAIMVNNLERMIPLVTNPLILQSGLVDVGELMTMWMQLIDYRTAKRIIRSPEQSTAVQTVMQAAQSEAQEAGGSPTGLIL
jgi:hypothetical protein